MYYAKQSVFEDDLMHGVQKGMERANHKYIGRMSTGKSWRYFYTKEQMQAAMNGGKRTASNAMNAVKNKVTKSTRSALGNALNKLKSGSSNARSSVSQVAKKAWDRKNQLTKRTKQASAQGSKNKGMNAVKKYVDSKTGYAYKNKMNEYNKQFKNLTGQYYSGNKYKGYAGMKKMGDNLDKAKNTFNKTKNDLSAGLYKKANNNYADADFAKMMYDRNKERYGKTFAGKTEKLFEDGKKSLSNVKKNVSRYIDENITGKSNKTMMKIALNEARNKSGKKNLTGDMLVNLHDSTSKVYTKARDKAYDDYHTYLNAMNKRDDIDWSILTKGGKNDSNARDRTEKRFYANNELKAARKNSSKSSRNEEKAANEYSKYATGQEYIYNKDRYEHTLAGKYDSAKKAIKDKYNTTKRNVNYGVAQAKNEARKKINSFLGNTGKGISNRYKDEINGRIGNNTQQINKQRTAHNTLKSDYEKLKKDYAKQQKEYEIFKKNVNTERGVKRVNDMRTDQGNYYKNSAKAYKSKKKKEKEIKKKFYTYMAKQKVKGNKQ